MDDGLVRQESCHKHVQVVMSLNPCCSGRWSRTCVYGAYLRRVRVLILIVVEDGLVRLRRDHSAHRRSVLILIVVEDGLVPELLASLFQRLR